MDELKLPLLLLDNTTNDLTTGYLNQRVLKQHWEDPHWRKNAVEAFKNGLENPMVINTEYKIRYSNIARPILFLERTYSDGVVDILDFFIY